MDTLEVIRGKEHCNEDSVYLYCLGGSWKAFGRSAFYLSLLYPELAVVKDDSWDIAMICICISDDYLMKVFEINRIYVGNEYIEMKIPEGVCYGQDEYLEWCNKLFDTVRHE